MWIAIQVVFLVLAVLTPLVLLVEAALTATWNRWYFTRGVRVFICRIPAPHTPPARPVEGILNSPARSAGTVASLAFRRIDDGTYGFRERVAELRRLKYTPVMRGLLILDAGNGVVIVKGYLYWTVIVFASVFITGALLPSPAFPLEWALAILPVTAVLYLIQALRFIGVARDAAYIWSLSLPPKRAAA